MSEIHLGIFLYSLSLAAQIGAAFFALTAIRFANHNRSCWIILSLGLTMMVGRRVSPILNILSDNNVNITDAWLSLPISILLLLGIMGVRKILLELHDKNTELKKITQFDFLTGALSRSETFFRTEKEIERSLRYGAPLSFLMLDIDHFKNINDAYGHQVGDEVLKHLAIFCQASLRKVDMMGRVGGEEFLIVLPDTNEKGALEVANRIRTSISEQTCSCVKNTPIKLTVSIGVSSLEDVLSKTTPQKTAAQLLLQCFELADQAMYQAKHKGRNRCCSIDQINQHCCDLNQEEVQKNLQSIQS